MCDAPLRTIPEMPLDGFGAETRQDQNVFDVVSPAQHNLVLDQRLTADLDHAFRKVSRTLLKPRALSARDDHQLHAIVQLGCALNLLGESQPLPARSLAAMSVWAASRAA